MRPLALGALYATALLAGTALMRAVRWAPMTWRNPFARRPRWPANTAYRIWTRTGVRAQCCIAISSRSTTAALALCIALRPIAGAAQERHIATVDPDGIQRIRIVGGSYFFRPNHVVVKVNVPVELSASRERGLAPHNLVLKAVEAGLALEEELSTETKTIVFKPTTAGNYPFYCSKKPPFVAGHRERGMEGVLEVVP